MKTAAHIIVFVLFSITPIRAIAQEQTLFVGTVGINAGGHWRYTFGVKDSGKIQGWFRVASKDVECLILDPQNYDLYSKGYDFFSVYSSGKVAASNINLKLRKGTYVLVLSNKHAVWYSKTVNGVITLKD